MYIEITKTNSYGEKGAALIKKDNVVAIKELHVGTIKSFDENHNLVSEQPAPKQYLVLMEHCEGFYIDETEYKKLVSILTK